MIIIIISSIFMDYEKTLSEINSSGMQFQSIWYQFRSIFRVPLINNLIQFISLC